MKTPQVKPDWAYGIYTGRAIIAPKSYKAPIVPTLNHCEGCGDLFICTTGDDKCDKCMEGRL